MAILILAAGFLVAIAVPTTNGAGYPVPPVWTLPKNVMDRRNNLQNFIEEKLVEHSQALEQLLRISKAQADELKRLVYYVGKDMSKTKLPEKTEAHRSTVRSGLPSTDEPRTLAHKVPVYGTLLRNFIVNEVSNDDEPTVLVEEHFEPDEQAEGRSGTMNSNGKALQPLLGVQVAVSVNKCPQAGPRKTDRANYPYYGLGKESRSAGSENDSDMDDPKTSAT